MMDDAMSSSHPVIKSVNNAEQINELFDSIETTKATGILRMADYYTEQSTNIKNITLSIIVVSHHRYVVTNVYSYEEEKK
jgi:aminopeptidase N